MPWTIIPVSPATFQTVTVPVTISLPAVPVTIPVTVIVTPPPSSGWSVNNQPNQTWV